ncbi:hypothetical protein JTE90_013953 [Oedothorax gibbosus]|uniref:Uncharacterized protein n=1 Tax=Oedothorax gibbosus TaxID=931172 RepID=A0AAV6UBU8_9ARAC|nr:hypothetical protein JTE90_013953 [Oedothorax gibbosus]
MLPKAGVLFFLVSFLAVFLGIGATLPSTLGQGSRRPGYVPGHQNPYNPGYPHRPGYPSRPGYPHQPSYPGGHDVYPEDDCKYGRPCDDEDHDLGGYDDGYGDDQSGYGQSGCSCILRVDHTVVFRRVNNRQRFQCNRYGLERCSRYCDELFQDDRLRVGSRQDACDVMGRDVFVPWYRRDQVCGLGGAYKDVPLPLDLCCKRGRPSLDCEDDYGH